MKRLIETSPHIRGNPKSFLDLPVVIRVMDFSPDDAEDFSSLMSKAHNTGQPVIPVIIDTYGGDAYGLISMVSDIKNASVPVATICIGKSMSSGAILLSCGTDGYRFMDPHSTVMLHDIAYGSYGKTEELKADANHTDGLQKQVFRMMSKNCGHKDPDYFLKVIHDRSHAEWYLTAKDAKKHKIINHIRVPTYTTKVSVEHVFK